MTRSKWKCPYTIKKVFNKKKQYIFSWYSKILPKYLGSTVQVYNGWQFEEFLVTEESIGHLFGEFVFTWAVFCFKKKKSKVLKKKK